MRWFYKGGGGGGGGGCSCHGFVRGVWHARVWFPEGVTFSPPRSSYSPWGHEILIGSCWQARAVVVRV